jgi:hypothetical protein
MMRLNPPEAYAGLRQSLTIGVTAVEQLLRVSVTKTTFIMPESDDFTKFMLS